LWIKWGGGPSDNDAQRRIEIRFHFSFSVGRKENKKKDLVDGQQLTTVAVVSILAATVVVAQSNRRRSGVIQRRSGRSGLVVVVNRRREIAVRFGAEAFQHSSPILRRHISHA
jgi:hypothetical protein